MNTLWTANSIENSEALGKLLKQLRKQKGLTQIEAAGICNVGVRFLLELEAGKPTAHLGKVFKVLHGYGLKMNLTQRSLAR